MSNVNVIRKSVEILGNELDVVLLEMDGKEGMTVKEAAKFLGLEERSVRKISQDNGFLVGTMSSDQIEILRSQGVVALKTTVASFVPRETFEALVKIVNTPQSWIIYNQLWAKVREVKEQEAAAETGFVAQLLNVLKGSDDIVLRASLESMAKDALRAQSALQKSSVYAKELQIKQAELEKALARNLSLEGSLEELRRVHRELMEAHDKELKYIGRIEAQLEDKILETMF